LRPRRLLCREIVRCGDMERRGPPSVVRGVGCGWLLLIRPCRIHVRRDSALDLVLSSGLCRIAHTLLSQVGGRAIISCNHCRSCSGCWGIVMPYPRLLILLGYCFNWTVRDSRLGRRALRGLSLRWLACRFIHPGEPRCRVGALCSLLLRIDAEGSSVSLSRCVWVFRRGLP